VVDVLGELVTQLGSNLVVALAGVAAGGGEAFQVGDRLNVPNDDIAHVAHAGKVHFKLLAAMDHPE
jgi:hypothetical protein